MPIEDILHIINNDREVTFEYHLLTAREWRRFGEPDHLHTPLIYSAFEYRCAIERFVFELFVIMNRDDLLEGDLDINRAERFSSLITIIHERAENRGRLYRMFRFNYLYTRHMIRLNIDVSIPDLRTLQQYWHSLSDYCHKQMLPNETWDSEDYVRNGYQIFNEVENYFYEQLAVRRFGWVQVESIPVEAQEFRLQFINEEINDKQLINYFNLMRPLFGKSLSKYLE